MVGGKLAVQAFFLISGFYMSLILNEKYSTDARGVWLFYSNRFLRIYPLYWSVLLLALSVYGLEYLLPRYFHSLGVIDLLSKYWHEFGIETKLYLLLSNLSIIGLDAVYYLRFDLQHPTLTDNWYSYKPYAFQFQFIPQAWSLSIEVLVYAIAPFLFRKSIWFLVSIFLLSFLARTITYDAGYNYDPWFYRFFPFEIGLFVAGSVAYRLYRSSSMIKNKLLGCVAFGLCVLLILGHQFVPYTNGSTFGFTYQELMFLVPFSAAVPAVFSISKHWRADRWIGELSYPVYLCHLIVVPMCNGSFGWGGITPAVGTLAMAALLVKSLDVPLERFRQNRVSKQVRDTQAPDAAIIQSSGPLSASHGRAS
jgi:peptidoglycan/LPS O-acetylase OafA/YrhL